MGQILSRLYNFISSLRRPRTPKIEKSEYELGLQNEIDKYGAIDPVRWMKYESLLPQQISHSHGIGHIIDHYHQYGWTTIPVLDKAEVEQYRDEIWKYLEMMTKDGKNIGIKRGDPNTWNEWRKHSSVGMLGQSLNHSEVHWKIREACHDYFSRIWNDEDLLVSFDGANFMSPHEGEWFREWFHCDRGRNDRDEYNRIQGQVLLTDSYPDDGGLVLIINDDGHKDSVHKLWNSYLTKRTGQGYSHFDIDIKDSLIVGKTFIKVCAPAGSLILWNSKVFHCNCPPRSIGGKERITMYVSMHPRRYATEEDLKYRRDGYEKGWVSGHVCVGPQSRPVPPAQDYYPTVGDIIIPPVECSDLRKRMIGY